MGYEYQSTTQVLCFPLNQLISSSESYPVEVERNSISNMLGAPCLRAIKGPGVLCSPLALGRVVFPPWLLLRCLWWELTGVLSLHALCHTWGGVLISKKMVLLWCVCGHQGLAPPGALHKHCPGPHFLWNPDFFPYSNPGPNLHSFFTLFKGPFPPGQ